VIKKLKKNTESGQQQQIFQQSCMQTNVCAMCRFQLGFDTGDSETRYLASYS